MRVALVLLLACSVARADSDDEKRSLALESDADAWRRAGFRLGLAATYSELVGQRGAPSGTAIGAAVRAGLRLDDEWSALATFQYARVASGTDAGLGGLRFAGTIDPTWHVTPYISLAVGFGFGGIVETGRDRMDPTPTPEQLETSYTFPNARTPIGSCNGVGVAGLVRAEWNYVLSSRISGHVTVEALGQWTGCVEDIHRVEPDSGDAIVRRQWWPHVGGTLSIGVLFR